MRHYCDLHVMNTFEENKVLFALFCLILFFFFFFFLIFFFFFFALDQVDKI